MHSLKAEADFNEKLRRVYRIWRKYSKNSSIFWNWLAATHYYPKGFIKNWHCMSPEMMWSDPLTYFLKLFHIYITLTNAYIYIAIYIYNISIYQCIYIYIKNNIYCTLQRIGSRLWLQSAIYRLIDAESDMLGILMHCFLLKNKLRFVWL